MNDLLTKSKNLLSKMIMVVILAVLIVGFAIAEPNFLKPGNLLIIVKQVSIVGVVTMGMAIIIIMGAIDLSAGPVIRLSCVITAIVSGIPGLPIYVPLLVGVATGTLFGVINGVIYAKGKIPPFIVTLGTSTIAAGLAMVIARGKIVDTVSEEFAVLGGGSLFNIKFLPYPVVFFLVTIAIVYYILKKIPFGRKIYAIGGNEQAAMVAGVKVDAIKIRAYIIMGILTGFAGAILCARLKCAPPATAAEGYELDAIAACIIGGISFNGGIGSCLGAVVGVLTIGTINNGLDILNVASYYQDIVMGVIIIIAVLLDRRRVKRGEQ